MAVMRARSMIMASHVSLLLYDATEGITRGDMQIADLIVKNGKSCIIVANKCDLLSTEERKRLSEDVSSKLPMLWYAAPSGPRGAVASPQWSLDQPASSEQPRASSLERAASSEQPTDGPSV